MGGRWWVFWKEGSEDFGEGELWVVSVTMGMLRMGEKGEDLVWVWKGTWVAMPSDWGSSMMVSVGLPQGLYLSSGSCICI